MVPLQQRRGARQRQTPIFHRTHPLRLVLHADQRLHTRMSVGNASHNKKELAVGNHVSQPRRRRQTFHHRDIRLRARHRVHTADIQQQRQHRTETARCRQNHHHITASGHIHRRSNIQRRKNDLQGDSKVIFCILAYKNIHQFLNS